MTRGIKLLQVGLSSLPLLLGSQAYALTAEEIGRRYDPEGMGKGRLGGSALRVYELHKADPVLAKFDQDNDGELNSAEYSALQRDIQQKYGPGRYKRPATRDPGELLRRGQSERRARDGIPINQLAEPAKVIPDVCDPTQSLYIRRDRLDNFMYGIVPRSAAKGASLSYTNDQLADQQSGVIDGSISYVIARDPCRDRPNSVGIFGSYLSGFAIAPWIEGHGKLTTGRRGEQSSLLAGVDLQGEIFSGGLFNLQYFTASPYVQTDYRGLARAAGITAFWEPYQLDWRLGGNYQRFSDDFDWFWQLRAEVDVKHVDDVGLTNLTEGRYAWIGGTARLHLFPFPATSSFAPTFLLDRIHLTGTAKWYWDAYSGRTIRRYSAEAAYNLEEDGSSSLSFEYAYGTEKETLERVNQYLLRLNYKY
jgi:hypothetical protein